MDPGFTIKRVPQKCVAHLASVCLSHNGVQLSFGGLFFEVRDLLAACLGKEASNGSNFHKGLTLESPAGLTDGLCSNHQGLGA